MTQAPPDGEPTLQDAAAERVVRAFNAAQARPQSVHSRSAIPGHWDSITNDWLTDVICAEAPGAAVIDFQFGPRDDGTSNRRRIYLQYNTIGQDRRLPSSVFCKASMGLQNRLSLGLMGCSHAESTFYTQLRPTLNIEAPRAYLATYDPESFAAIGVFEDLSEQVEFCDEDTHYNLSHAEGQVDLLATLHSRYYQQSQLGKGGLGFQSWPQWFANLERTVQLRTYCDKGFRAAEEVIPTRLYRRADDVWPATQKSVQHHLRLPPTLLHADAHAKNWYYRTDGGRMGLADWQACCIGNWARDYAYTVSSSLQIEDRRLWERELLRRYLEQLGAHGVANPPSFNEAWRLYRQQLLAGLSYWTITLTPAPNMPDMQPRKTTIEIIKRISHAVDDLETLDSFD